jgi:hypothetical protein
MQLQIILIKLNYIYKKNLSSVLCGGVHEGSPDGRIKCIKI